MNVSAGRYDAGRPRWPDDRHRLVSTDQEFLTVEDLARLLCIPKATIYRWRSAGVGPRGHTIGRYVRFRRSDVEEWLAERADDPRPDSS